jgi:hypothetical protein
VALQTLFLRWMVLAYDLVEDKDKLQAVYGAIFV